MYDLVQYTEYFFLATGLIYTLVFFAFYTQMMTNVLLATAHHQQHVPILRVDLTARARVGIYRQDQEHAKVSVYFKLETMSVNLTTWPVRYNLNLLDPVRED